MELQKASFLFWLSKGLNSILCIAKAVVVSKTFVPVCFGTPSAGHETPSHLDLEKAMDNSGRQHLNLATYNTLTPLDVCSILVTVLKKLILVPRPDAIDLGS